MKKNAVLAIHIPVPGSLLISKLEFFIKADFRGLSFLLVGPMSHSQMLGKFKYGLPAKF